MRQPQFSRVLLHTRFELDRFRSTLARLDARQFPSSTAKQRIKTLRDAAEATDGSLSAIEHDLADDPDGAFDRLISEYRKMIARRRQLEVLEKAGSDEVPWSLVPSVELLAAGILPGRPVLVTTTPDMNYMVSWSKSPAETLVTVYLPKLHRANAYLHLLIGHELFHPALEKYFDHERTRVLPLLREDCKSIIAEVDGGTADLFLQKRLDAVLAQAMSAWERGLTELMCDMGAVALFGPPAFWTLCSFAASQSLDALPSAESGYYPPWRDRIRNAVAYMFDVDDAESQLTILKSALEVMKLNNHANALQHALSADLTLHRTPPPARRYTTFLSKVYERIWASIPSAQTYISTIASPIAGRWRNTLEQVPFLIKRLEMLIPPSEILSTAEKTSRPSDMTAIATCFWVERLRAEHAQSLDLPTYRRLCRLMLKAIEDADLKRQFSARGLA